MRQVEGEEAGDGRRDGVAAGGEEGIALFLGVAADGADDCLRLVALGRRVYLPAPGCGLQSRDLGVEADVDAEAAGLVEEAVDDGFAAVAFGEHAPVGLRFEAYAAAGKPGQGIRYREAGKHLAEFFFAARVVAHQLARFEAVVGNVAAAPTRHPHFGKQLAAFFEDGDAGLRKVDGRVDGRKETRGAAPDDEDVLVVLHGGKDRRFCHMPVAVRMLPRNRLGVRAGALLRYLRRAAGGPEQMSSALPPDAGLLAAFSCRSRRSFPGSAVR